MKQVMAGLETYRSIGSLVNKDLELNSKRLKEDQNIDFFDQ